MIPLNSIERVHQTECETIFLASQLHTSDWMTRWPHEKSNENVSLRKIWRHNSRLFKRVAVLCVIYRFFDSDSEFIQNKQFTSRFAKREIMCVRRWTRNYDRSDEEDKSFFFWDLVDVLKSEFKKSEFLFTSPTFNLIWSERYADARDWELKSFCHRKLWSNRWMGFM